MDLSETAEFDNEDSATMKTIKAATTGFVAGTIWGTILATWYDVPRVERHVALPGLIRTIKMCGNYGVTFAAVSGIYIGVEQLVQKQRIKRDFINGAVGAFVAGASVYGLKGYIEVTCRTIKHHRSLSISSNVRQERVHLPKILWFLASPTVAASFIVASCRNSSSMKEHSISAHCRICSGRHFCYP